MLLAFGRRMHHLAAANLAAPTFASEWLICNRTTLQLQLHTSASVGAVGTSVTATSTNFDAPATSYHTHPHSHSERMTSYAQALQSSASMSSSAVTNSQPHTDVQSTIHDLLHFWFGDLPKYSSDAPASKEQEKQVVSKWFTSSAEFDEQCKQRYLQLYKTLQNDTALEQQFIAAGDDGVIALLVLYDQLSRNLFRGSAEAFAKDSKAQQLSLSMVKSGAVDKFSPMYQSIITMSLLHSEDIEHQRVCLQQAEKRNDKQQIQFCQEHLQVIERFSRMPHRNAVLGRETTAAEAEFMNSPDAPGWMKSQQKPAATAGKSSPHSSNTQHTSHPADHRSQQRPPSYQGDPSHRRANQHADHNPLIVTLQLDKHAQKIMNDLRKQHFPPKRNFLEAHVTLFHALPAEHEADIKQLLSELSANTPIFDIIYDKPMLLGKGVALDAQRSKIGGLHRKMQHIWKEWLTPQDSQRLRQHVTIQNKVEPEEAKQLYEQLQQTWQALHCKATGFELYRYVAPRWEFITDFKFSPQQQQQ